MNSNVFEEVEHFSRGVRAFLAESEARGELSHYACLVESDFDIVSTLHSGFRHSKAPTQAGVAVSVRCVARCANGKSFSVDYVGNSLAEFTHCYAEARVLAVALKHNPQLERHSAYPRVELASSELLEILLSEAGAHRVDELCRYMDELAGKVEHPRIMARETQVLLGCHKRVYFDNAQNFAEEFSTECSLSATYMLSDSTEHHSDSFGKLPTPSEIEGVVREAARNLTRHDVREFTEQGNVSVLLTPKAVATLVGDLVLPNLSARCILDGTSAWASAHLQKVVLPGVSVRDNPLVEYSPFSRLFDAEGTPARQIDVMRDGVLLHPLLTAALLAELHAELENVEAHGEAAYHLSGHAVSAVDTAYTNLNIGLSGKMAMSFDDMLEEEPLCVVVNNLTGVSVDSITGQFALDAEGARVYKSGRLAYSTSITLRGNFFEAVSDAENSVGPCSRVGNMHVPSLRTRRLSCVSHKMSEGD
jgi:predicted Zn-dependent protease